MTLFYPMCFLCRDGKLLENTPVPMLDRHLPFAGKLFARTWLRIHISGVSQAYIAQFGLEVYVSKNLFLSIAYNTDLVRASKYI